ncbi:MAG: hypothetical protein ACE5IO_00950 [Thermoplasmata archaeon]
MVLMPPKAKSKEEWFDVLDKELVKKTDDIINTIGEQNSRKVQLNRQLIGDLWEIWKRFNKINVHFAMEPHYNAFAQFEEFPYGAWTWRSSFNVASVNNLQLVDRTQDQGRTGDSLLLSYVPEKDDKIHLRVEFLYCEGEHYYKYSGWRRMFARHTLYDKSIEKVDVDNLHSIFADIITTWYESHLRRNRDIILRHLKEAYKNVETFTQ